MSNIIGSPIPPIGNKDGEIIIKIIKAIKILKDIFKKPSEEAGKTDSVNDNSSLENIDRIIQIFSDFKDQVHAKALDIENTIDEEVNFYVEELHSILQDNSKKVDKYGISIKRIERQIDKISSKIKGTIDNEISKNISLDNAECRKIVNMIPGSKKEQAMNSFLNKSIKNALEVCCREFRVNIEEIYEDVETEVISAVESIQKQNELLQERFNSIDKDNYEETAKKQIINAYYLMDVCNLIEQIF
ncbi:hypothetical protein Q428_04640 [Fervidicella metallireducens AeB]|uniref:Uncharacterized protein n=1 Tax=Fervidicella metallireducens AeB TaxID=1403537 RepID=A0A017RXJ2_9CLOT|nr:hypothetical protein [Fervidicella metallireducens]EYE89099.1 hypothetical protein Q428_04640 [Fervidicella metallireducens AeB]